MSNKFTILFLLLVSTNLWSQNKSFAIGYTGRLLLNATFAENSNSNVEGSQYIDDKFYPSQFSCVDEVTPPIRYNAYRDEMEFMKDGKMYYANKIDSCVIILSNKFYKYVSYKEKDITNGYLVLLTKTANSKYNLYKKEKVIYVPEYVPNSNYGDPKPANYAVEKSKFFIGNQEDISEFPNKKNEFLKLFPTQKEILETYIKENKISFSDELSLIKLVDYLNTL